MLILGALAPAASAVGSMPCAAFTGYINGYRINIRSGPGTSHAVCGIAMCGDPMLVTSQCYVSGGRLWYYGTVGTVCGWVYSGYVCGAPIVVNTTVTTCTAGCTSACITMDYTNFRSGPGTCYSSILQLMRGTALEITGAVRDCYGSVWYQAQVCGLTGWVRSDLVSAGTAVCAGTACGSCFVGCTNTCAVNVRLCPNGARIAQLDRGTCVYVTGSTCEWGVWWYQIDYWGRTAYIRADLVSPACTSSLPGTGSCGGTCYGIGTAVPGGTMLYNAPGTCYGIQSGSLGTQLPDTAGSQVPGTGYSAAGGQAYGSGAIDIFGTDETAPSAAAAAAPQAVASAGRASLSFSTFDFTAGQVLPVFTAPNAASLRADNGTAVMTVTGRVWVAGYDGQWLLVMYQNENRMTRVGYVNAFQMQGTLPDVPGLTFSGTAALVSVRTALTTDPMERTDTVMMLDSGDSVTWLADLDLNGTWAYVETYCSGVPVRGFVPRTAIK